MFRERLPHIFGLAALGAAALLTPDAWAQSGPSPQQIKEAAGEFDLGIKAAQGKDFDAAAAHFENADRMAPSPEALRAAIRARRDAKQAARAATLAEMALARYADNKDLAAFASGVVSQLAPSLHKVSVGCKPDCVLVVDQRLVPGEAAASITLYLEPGPHTVAAGWGQKSASEKVEAKAGESSKLSFAPPKEEKKPEPKPAVAPPPKEEPRPAPTAAGGETKKAGGLPPGVVYGGLIVTGVLAGVTAWSGVDTQNNPGPDAVRQLCVNQGESCSAYQDGLSRQRRTNVLIASTAGVAVVTGVVALFFTDWGGGEVKPTSGSRLVPQLGLGRDGASIGASGSFLGSQVSPCRPPSSSTKRKIPGSIATSSSARSPRAGWPPSFWRGSPAWAASSASSPSSACTRT